MPVLAVPAARNEREDFANICRDTATSAIWKMTLRQWLTTLAPV